MDHPDSVIVGISGFVRPVRLEVLMNPNLRRWMALVVVCFGQLMIMLDTTIVNVALPYIQRDLRFSQADLTWVVNAYLIAFGGFLLLAGRMGDLIGRRKVFLAGVFLFTVASVGTGFAPAAGNLIAGRFLQGVGASLSAGVIIAIIVTEFQKPAERAQAMSVFTLVIAGGGSLGLLAGGFLTQWMNWHWIFFINLPIGILTLLLGAWLIEENEGLGLSQGVDLAGVVLITNFFVGALYLQHVRGYSAFQTGLAFLPTTLMIGVMSSGIAARLMARVGPRNLLIGGLAIIIAALTILANAGPGTGYAPELLAAYVLLGAGAGSSFLPLLTISMSEVPLKDAGLGSGFGNVVMQVGGALGLASVTSISTSNSQGFAAFQMAYVLAAICVAASLIVVVTVLRTHAAQAAVEDQVRVEEAAA